MRRLLACLAVAPVLASCNGDRTTAPPPATIQIPPAPRPDAGAVTASPPPPARPDKAPSAQSLTAEWMTEALAYPAPLVARDLPPGASSEPDCLLEHGGAKVWTRVFSTRDAKPYDVLVVTLCDGTYAEPEYEGYKPPLSGFYDEFEAQPGRRGFAWYFGIGMAILLADIQSPTRRSHVQVMLAPAPENLKSAAFERWVAPIATVGPARWITPIAKRIDARLWAP